MIAKSGTDLQLKLRNRAHKNKLIKFGFRAGSQHCLTLIKTNSFRRALLLSLSHSVRVCALPQELHKNLGAICELISGFIY